MDKNIINGYYTFNTVVVDEENKQLHLVDTKVYSNREPKFVSQEELESFEKGNLQKSEDPAVQERTKVVQELVENDDYINVKKVTLEQLEKTSQAFKKEQPDSQITHVLDAGFDSQDIFFHIYKELEDKFVIRQRTSRNSGEIYIDDNSSPQFIKLIDAKFANKKSFPIRKVEIKGKVYQQVSCFIEYDEITFGEQTYKIVRVTLKDRKGRKIFKKPMLLLTNRKVKTIEQAHGVYLFYLKRSKIEGVFKFLKNVLGWEEFQVRDFESIKNIIALCFFIGGYFYEIESELIENTTVQYICDLGGGKGRYTRYFFLQGLSKILVYKSVEEFV